MTLVLIVFNLLSLSIIGVGRVVGGGGGGGGGWYMVWVMSKKSGRRRRNGKKKKKEREPPKVNRVSPWLLGVSPSSRSFAPMFICV